MSIVSYIVNMDEFVDEMIYQLKKDFELSGGDSNLGFPRIFGVLFDGKEGVTQTKQIPIEFTGLLKQILIKKDKKDLCNIKLKIGDKEISFPLEDDNLKITNTGLDYIVDGEFITVEVIMTSKDKIVVDFVCLVPTEEGDI